MQEFDVICSECGDFFKENLVTHVGHNCYCHHCFDEKKHSFSKVHYHPAKTHKAGLFLYGTLLGILLWAIIIFVPQWSLNHFSFKWSILTTISEHCFSYKYYLLIAIPLLTGMLAMLFRQRVIRVLESLSSRLW